MLRGYETSCQLAHKNVRVVSQCGITKYRQAFGYVRDVIANNVFMFNNSMSVMHRALMERLYYVKNEQGEFAPCPLPTHSFDDLSGFATEIRRNLPSLPPVWSYEQFVSSYSGSKAKRYASAVATLTRTGVKRTYGYLKTFIKGEFYDATLKRNPCPRLIQPRSACYNVLIGRYLRPAEKLIYKAIDRTFGHHVVLKCDPPWKRAAVIKQYWGEFANPVYVGFDASRFDQHTSRSALEWEHSIYNSMFHSPELAEYLEWQIDNVGFATTKDGTLAYKVEGCRMSGDMNTALGNVLIMSGICHHFLSGLGVHYRFIDDGDDCGVFLDAQHLHLLDELPEHHLRYGYEMTVEPPAYRLEHIEFCQSRPIDCGDGNYMMVRNVHKALKQDALCIDKRDWAEQNDVMCATGVCGLALYAGFPVLEAFYSMLARIDANNATVQRLLDEFKTGPQSWRSAKGCRGFSVDETAARVSMYYAFGLLPDAQVEMEDEFRAQSLGNLTQILTQTNATAESAIQYYK